MKRLLLLIGISSLGLAANATVIYDNGGPNLASGNEMGRWIQADDVKLDTPGKFNTIVFWTLEDGTAFHSLDVSFYDNNGDNTPTYLFERDNVSFTHTATGRVWGGGALTEYEVVATISDIYAGNSIPFYVGLHANGSTARQDIYWETTDANSTQPGMEYDLQSPAWKSNNLEHAFQLEYNPVPEPATLLALGAGALALIRRRK